jgi:hypothetical protein
MFKFHIGVLFRKVSYIRIIAPCMGYPKMQFTHDSDIDSVS